MKRSIIIGILCIAILIHSIQASNCTPAIKNTSWSNWTSDNNCNYKNLETDSRFLTSYDQNNCILYENLTTYQERVFSCDYCSFSPIEITTNWSECNNSIKTRTTYYLDQNYDSCCKITNQTSDCIENFDEYKNKTDLEFCSDFNISLNIPDMSVFNTKKINLTIGIEKNSSILGMTLGSEKSILSQILCKNCMNFSKLITFKEGENILVIYSVFGTNQSAFAMTKFVIDTKKPVVNNQVFNPKFTNGTFIINYSEINLDFISLIIGNLSINKTDCQSGNFMSCVFIANLSNYNNINYFFILKDKAGNMETTKQSKILVDAIPPKINKYEHIPILNDLYITLNITEQNFKDVSFIDNFDKMPKYRILCQSLNNGICDKKITLTKGIHDIVIKVSDKAGNNVYFNA